MSTETSRGLERVISGVALALLLIACALVLRPFASALLWAVVLWIASVPVHQRVLALVRQRRGWAAFVMTAGVSLILLLPILVVGISLADSAKDLTLATQKWFGAGPSEPPAWISRIPLVGEFAANQWRVLAGDSERLFSQLRSFIEPTTTWLLTGGLALGRGIAELMLSILIAFFLFRDGGALAPRLRAGVERIAGARGDHLLELAANTVRSVVYGILGTALVQGIMAGIGFLIAGVPGAVLLGLLTFFMSIVPMGPPLVWIPAAVWLFQHEQGGWGIFMVIWGVGVSSIDNFVKPWLISQGSALPFILIFFGVLGGVLAFGFVGVFLGPTLLAVAYRLVQDWAVVRIRAAAADAALADRSG
jgi:predicted PurR-regulated permease PerM